MSKWREMALDMRRTAVNLIEFHVSRCDGDECNHFATWEREHKLNSLEVTNFSCDRCISDMRYHDDRAASKGYGKRDQWKERNDAGAIRELTKSSISISENAR